MKTRKLPMGETKANLKLRKEGKIRATAQTLGVANTCREI